MNIIKLVGYGLGALGILGLVFSISAASKYAGFLEGFGKSTVTITSVCLVIVGVLIVSVFSKKSGFGKIEHVQDEVPIYRGEGKDRRIVGYKAESE